MIKSQITTTEEIKKIVKDINIPVVPDGLVKLKDLMYSRLVVRPYDSSAQESEKLIRWKRTAAEILQDGYVYSGKACTDLTVLFIALCRALNLETNFVKLKKENKVHSVAEVKLASGWYIFDVADRTSQPVPGIITAEQPYQGWQLWQKGRDAWDLGLSSWGDIKKIID